MHDFEIRPARDDELTAVAALRWQWVIGNGNRPAVSQDTFIADFVAWARENASTHRCFIAADGGTLVGMAWLATIHRVPTPRSSNRKSGDVQSVYVVPGERDNGLGGRLIDTVLATAAELGFEPVTVHSSERAITTYKRHGFATSPRLLQAVTSRGVVSSPRQDRREDTP
ncbi:GNAT family N-acetyltransferase [Amycolatopsis sp. GM8]|uniref:GNAT family N-acetyltransferase n=1 Tax=Amycolatopsis sp. GM8 TaxID=2896530 RepID=UPI001F2D7116|nr:GNAT family N-acetyltransferase [Amycolatopsis sp. GM8]